MALKSSGCSSQLRKAFHFQGLSLKISLSPFQLNFREANHLHDFLSLTLIKKQTNKTTTTENPAVSLYFKFREK